MEWVREPAAAGRFYAGDGATLARDVSGFLSASAGDAAPEPSIMLMGPHAGYVYSGAIAGRTYARVRVPSRAIVLCPNHTGLGARRSVWPTGRWRLPGGDVPVDAELAAAVRDAAGLEDDRLAHLREHSLEVHLPFLRARRSDVAIVPICLGPLTLDHCRDIGSGIADAVRRSNLEVLIVASTDMSHYISADRARELDALALGAVQQLDPEALYRTVKENDISMCGYIPTTVALFASRELGARRAELVCYGNSGDVSGDYDQVVGYAGVAVS